MKLLNQLLRLLLIVAFYNNSFAQTTINGNIYRVALNNEGCSALSNTEAITDVTLQVYDATTNNLLETTQTDVVGAFTVNVNAENVKIVPTRTGNWSNGVSTLDKIILNNHLLGTVPLNCPFQRIAADVNNDGELNMVDDSLYAQFILNNIESFPNVPNWRFISRNYTRTDKGNRDIGFATDFWNNQAAKADGSQYPFNAIYRYDESNAYGYSNNPNWMEQLNVYPTAAPCDTSNPAFQDTGTNAFNENTQSSIGSSSNWDFYGIKTGDVNHSATTNFSEDGETDRNRLSQIYSIEKPTNQNLVANKIYHLIIRATADQAIIAFQLGLDLDLATVHLKEIIPNATLQDYMIEHAFSNKKAKDASERKEIRTTWMDTTLIGKDWSDGMELFKLILEVNENTTLDEVFQLNFEVLPIEFVGKNASLVPAEINIQIQE